MPATKPKRAGVPVHYWIPSELSDAFDAYLASLDMRPTATAAHIKALEEFLERRGFWPPEDIKEDDS